MPLLSRVPPQTDESETKKIDPVGQVAGAQLITKGGGSAQLPLTLPDCVGLPHKSWWANYYDCGQIITITFNK